MWGMAGALMVRGALLRFCTVCMLLLGARGTAQATDWHIDKTQDPFTNTENISVQATGDDGGGFLAQCYEGHFRFFVEAVEPLPPVPKPNDLVSLLKSSIHITFRFRVDQADEHHGSIAVENAMHRDGKAWLEYDVGDGLLNLFANGSPLEKLIRKLASGNQFVYQIPSDTGPVYKIPLLNSAKYLLPLVKECVSQQNAKAAAEAKPPRLKPKPPPQASLESTLRSVERIKPRSQPDQAEKVIKDLAQATPRVTSSVDDKMTISEIDAVRRQIERCWNVPAGAKDAKDLVVDIHVVLNPDGTVREATVVDQSRMNSDDFFREAAESARRAVYTCSPLKLPPEKYSIWRDMTLSFNPSQILVDVPKERKNYKVDERREMERVIRTNR